MLDQIGGRKFFFAIILSVVASVLVIMERISFKEWGDFEILIAGLYIIGNLGTKVTNSLK